MAYYSRKICPATGLTGLMIKNNAFKKMVSLLAVNGAVISNFAFYTPTTLGYAGLSRAEQTSGNVFISYTSPVKIDRAFRLKKMLERYHSPLANQTETFITVADEYHLDWRLLPAITGMESTFGQFLIEGSNNPFGWGGGYIYFDSFEAGIETVGRELSRRFKSHTSPEDIGPTYTPPNYKNWINGVNYFMRELEKTQ